MEIEKHNNSHTPPAIRATSPAIGDEILELCQQPANEMEAGITYLFDKLNALQKNNPLAALRESIYLNQSINAELLKAYTPALVAAATERADHFARTGQLTPFSKAEEKLLGMMMKLQEGAIRLSLANVKVSDEIQRRHRLHSKGTGNEQEERE